jgi:mannosyltransferase
MSRPVALLPRRASTQPALQVGGKDDAAWQGPAIPRADRRWLGVLLILGALLRVTPIRGLWSDEAISVQQAHLPFGEMVRQLGAFDVHPPLWGIVLWADVRVFGDGELAVRVPSLVFGLAAIPLAYATGRELFDRRAGLAAATLTTAAPIAVWYSGEARMYSLYLLLSFLAIYAQARILRRPSVPGWSLFALSCAALFYTHYFSVFQVLAQHAIFAAVYLGKRRSGSAPMRKAVGRWLAFAGLTVLLVLPLAWYTPHQLQPFGAPGAGGRGDGGGISLYGVIANLVWAGWGYHSDNAMVHLAALWPVAMLGVLVLLGKRRSTPTVLLTVLVAGPLSCAFAVGNLVSTSMFELRYFICIVPPLLLLAARAITSWPRTRVGTLIAGGVVVVTMLAALPDQQFSSTNPRLYDYRDALAEVAAQSHPGDVLVYAPAFIAPVVSYYRPETATVAVGTAIPMAHVPGRRAFIVASFLGESANAAAVGESLALFEQAGWTVLRVHHLDNVTLWVLR